MLLPKPSDRSSEQGFTLVELLIVVAIIGILAAIAIPQFGKYRASAAKGSMESDLRTCMSEAVADYAAGKLEENDTYACDDDGGAMVDGGIAIVIGTDGDLSLNDAATGIDSYDGINFEASIDCEIEDSRRLVCEDA